MMPEQALNVADVHPTLQMLPGLRRIRVLA
jgi:hypothetical protein